MNQNKNIFRRPWLKYLQNSWEKSAWSQQSSKKMPHFDHFPRPGEIYTFMCVNVCLAKREWHNDMLYLHQTGSPHTPLVTWHKLFDQRCCILFSWTTKTMRTFRFSFPFTLSTKANLCVFNLQCMPDRAVGFKTWGSHDILNLVPVEHLWYAICKKYFRLDVHFESESVNQISQLQSLLVLNGFCGKTVGKCCQGFCFHTRFSFSMWWCFLQTLPRLLRLYRVLLDHVMVLMEKRK